MPQLDFLSYMSQLVGLVAILILLYIITLKWFLPQMKAIQEVRNLFLQEKKPITTPLEPFSNLLTNHSILLEAHHTLAHAQAESLLQHTSSTYLKRASKEYGTLLSHLYIQRNVY